MRDLKIIVYAVGILTSFISYGILQEKIIKSPYGSGDEKFKCILVLVFVQCIVNFIFAKISLVIKPQGEDTTRLAYYAGGSLALTVGMVSANKALQWVTFPTQVMAKSAKPIPVMTFGVLLGRKSYFWRQYVFVLLVVAGVVVFSFYEREKAKNPAAAGSSSHWKGELLIVLSLFMDGVLGAVQERMKGESQTKSRHMMSNMNMWSALFLCIGILASGELFDFIGFAEKHPGILWRLALLALAGVTGQFFIFMTVSEFGPLPCAMITTTRKFFSIVGSVIIFGHHLVWEQWTATILVFSGLTLDILYGT